MFNALGLSLNTTMTILLGSSPHRDKDHSIEYNFWKFYLIRISFTLGEVISFGESV
jgi:hypothetical protein